LDISSIVDGPAQIQMYNQYGQLLKSESMNMISGLNKLEMDVRSITPGIYFISIQNGAQKQVIRVDKATDY
jgi:hypothetical protein